MELNNINNKGAWSEIATKLNQNFLKILAELLKYQHVTTISGANFLGYFTSNAVLPNPAEAAWAVAGDLKAVTVYAYYTSDAVPSGFSAGWNALSSLGTYDFTDYSELLTKIKGAEGKLSELEIDIYGTTIFGNSFDVRTGSKTKINILELKKNIQYTFDFLFTNVSAESYISIKSEDGVNIHPTITVGTNMTSKSFTITPDNNYSGAYIEIANYSATIVGSFKIKAINEDSFVKNIENLKNITSDLVSSVEQITNSYQYQGTATPSTEIVDFGSMKVYYDAYIPGFYKNFNLTITEPKRHIISWDGEKWSVSNPSTYLDSPTKIEPYNSSVLYSNEKLIYVANRGFFPIKDDTEIGSTFDNLERQYNDWTVGVMFEVKKGDIIKYNSMSYDGYCPIALLSLNTDYTYTLKDKVLSTDGSSGEYISPYDGVIVGMSYSETINSNKYCEVKKIELLAPQIDLHSYGCNQLITIKSKDDLIGITTNYADSSNIYFLLITDIQASSSDEAEIIIPESSVFDFNNHCIKINNNSNFYFKSSFNYNDDGANFDKYPKLIYDRVAVPRPLYISNNESWIRMPLRGMFRVNDDTVYLSDFYRGCMYNKALASFCRCKIILEDVTLNYSSSDNDDDYAYGINSDVLLEGATNSVVTINNYSIKLRVVGNNVVIKNLKIELLNTTSVSEITVTPLNEFDVTNFKFSVSICNQLLLNILCVISQKYVIDL